MTSLNPELKIDDLGERKLKSSDFEIGDEDEDEAEEEEEEEDSRKRRSGKSSRHNSGGCGGI